MLPSALFRMLPRLTTYYALRSGFRIAGNKRSGGNRRVAILNLEGLRLLTRSKPKSTVNWNTAELVFGRRRTLTTRYQNGVGRRRTRQASHQAQNAQQPTAQAPARRFSRRLRASPPRRKEIVFRWLEAHGEAHEARGNLARKVNINVVKRVNECTLVLSWPRYC